MSLYVGPGWGEILFQISLSECHGMPDPSSGSASASIWGLGRHPGLQPDVRQYLEEEGGNPVAVFGTDTIVY